MSVESLSHEAMLSLAGSTLITKGIHTGSEDVDNLSVRCDVRI